MKLTLTMNCDNAAFGPDANREIARIFRQLAYRIEQCEPHSYWETFPPALRDANGNTVGEITFDA